MLYIAPETTVATHIPADIRYGDEDITRKGDKWRHMSKLHRIVHNYVGKELEMLNPDIFIRYIVVTYLNNSVTAIFCKFSVTEFNLC